MRSISRFQNGEGELVLRNSAFAEGEGRRIDEDEESDRWVPPEGDEWDAVDDGAGAGGNAEENVARGEGRGGGKKGSGAAVRRICGVAMRGGNEGKWKGKEVVVQEKEGEKREGQEEQGKAGTVGPSCHRERGRETREGNG